MTQVPHAPTHLELTRVLAMKVSPEMEKLALVGKNYSSYIITVYL